jgi:hypothetical protein
MRRVPSPPTAPIDEEVYLVLDDFDEFGIAYRETDPHDANEKTVVQYMLEGQFNRPLKVVAFNASEGWARDVSEDIARAVATASLSLDGGLTEGTQAFVDEYIDDRWPLKREPV